MGAVIKCECQNCSWVGPASDLVPLEEPGIFEIVGPGETMPFGRCPECGAVAHAAESELHPMSDWRYEVANGDTVLGYCEWLVHRIEEDDVPADGPEDRSYDAVLGRAAKQAGF